MYTDNNDFARVLEQQASLFSTRIGGENESAVKTYIVADLEFSYDTSRHEAYAVQEGKGAERTRPSHTVAADRPAFVPYSAGTGYVVVIPRAKRCYIRIDHAPEAVCLKFHVNRLRSVSPLFPRKFANSLRS
ncbi:MAG: hypothetical protein WA908_10400 [Pontixanthobacter sp.]